MQVEIAVPVHLLLEVNEYQCVTAVSAKAKPVELPEQPSKWTSRELDLARRQLERLSSIIADQASAIAQRDETIARLESKLLGYQERFAA